jgi:hypothetical protein
MGSAFIKLIVDGHKHSTKVHFGSNARQGIDGGTAEKIVVFGEHRKLTTTCVKRCNAIQPSLVFLKFLPAKCWNN